MSVLVSQVDFKLLVATKKVLSVKLTRIDADEKFPRSECSYVPKRTAHDCVLCEICGYLFANEFIFRKHFLHYSFHHLQSFKCERCDRLFQTEHLLKRHQVNFKIQSDWRCKPYQCHACSRRFSQMKFLKNHFSLNRKCVLNCAVCGQDFLKRKMLMRHIIENHIPVIPKIKTKDDYSVLQDFGILQGNTVTCTCPQNTSPHSVKESNGEDISVIKIEPLVMDTKSTKYNAACLTNSTTMEPPKPFIKNPFDSLDLENVLNLVENDGMYVPRDNHLTMHNTSQTTTEKISSVPIQYHHAAIGQLMAENCSFQKQNTQDPFSSNSSRAMTNDSVYSQHQQAALLQFLPRKDASKSHDTLTVSADSQVIQYNSQQSVFPDSFSGHKESLVQKNHRVLSDLLKKPPLIVTLSPAQNQSHQFLFQQVNTERESSHLKRTSTEGDQVIHGFVQIPQDQTGHQMCEEKQCVLTPGLTDQRFHNAFEHFSIGADGQIYSLMKNTSQNNVPKETEDQSEPDTSILVANLPSGSQVVIQNKVCNITPCHVCKKKFIYAPGSDQHVVNVFQCTKCKIIFSQEKEVLTHKCGKMDVPILSYSIKTKKTVQPNELAIVSGATRNSEELQKSFTSAIVAQHSEYEAAKNCHVSKDASAAVSDQCCQSCRSVVNVSKPQTQPMVYLIDDPSHVKMIQNLSGNAISLLFESGSSFDEYPCNRAADLLKTTIDSSHRNNTMQVPECLQRKTLDSCPERESLKNVVACLKQKVIEKIRNHISCLIDQSYKENISNSIQSEQSFHAYSTKYSDQVRLQQEDRCVWNDTPMDITSERNQTFLVGMTCNMTNTSGNQEEDSSQENKNAQIISTTQIKEEVIEPTAEQKLRGGHVGTSISDKVSEMGEGLLHQMEEAAEKRTWTNPIELIKGEEFVITDSKKQIQIFEERSARIDSLDSKETLEKPKLINLLGGMEGTHEGAIWTDSTGDIKVFSQNCNEVEMDSTTLSNPDIKFMESPEMDICTVNDEFDIVGSTCTSVLPEGFVYVENL